MFRAMRKSDVKVVEAVDKGYPADGESLGLNIECSVVQLSQDLSTFSPRRVVTRTRARNLVRSSLPQPAIVRDGTHGSSRGSQPRRQVHPETTDASRKPSSRSCATPEGQDIGFVESWRCHGYYRFDHRTDRIGLWSNCGHMLQYAHSSRGGDDEQVGDGFRQRQDVGSDDEP